MRSLSQIERKHHTKLIYRDDYTRDKQLSYR